MTLISLVHMPDELDRRTERGEARHANRELLVLPLEKHVVRREYTGMLTPEIGWTPKQGCGPTMPVY